MIDLNDVLLAMSNIPVDDPIAEIWGRGLQGGYKIIEYTGSLPITINANGDVLLDYRIYGADGGVGEPTENLFNGQGTENYGYYSNDNGRYIYNKNYKYWRFSVEEGDIIRWTIPDAGYGCYFSNGVYKGRIYTTSTPFTVPADIDEITNNFHSRVWDSAIVTKNQPIPDQYIPYGYKLPMTVSDGNTAQTVPVYIGENKLGEDEYVSFSDQKIYRDVGGTLTPTDLPIPLPEIPTIDGTTTIDYDGTPKPSQVYVKYKGKE